MVQFKIFRGAFTDFFLQDFINFEIFEKVFIILVRLTVTLFSEKMLISNIDAYRTRAIITVHNARILRKKLLEKRFLTSESG